MEESGYLVSAPTKAQIERLIADRGSLSGGAPIPSGPPAVAVLKVQAGSPNGYYGYPVRIEDWSAGTGTLSDLGTITAWARDHNGNIPVVGQTLVGRLLGVNPSGEPCFEAVPGTLIAGSPVQYTISPGTASILGSGTLATLSMPGPGMYLVFGQISNGAYSTDQIAVSTGLAVGGSVASYPGIYTPTVGYPTTFAFVLVLSSVTANPATVPLSYVTGSLTPVSYGGGYVALVPIASAVRDNASGSSALAVGTTPITGGTSAAVLYDAAGVVGEASGLAISGGNPWVKLGSGKWAGFSVGSH